VWGRKRASTPAYVSWGRRGPVLGVEAPDNELAGGEHPVITNQLEDGLVAAGEVAGEAGELVGHARATAGADLLG
jgi:hypothetical protein